MENYLYCKIILSNQPASKICINDGYNNKIEAGTDAKNLMYITEIKLDKTNPYWPRLNAVCHGKISHSFSTVYKYMDLCSLIELCEIMSYIVQHQLIRSFTT